MWVVWVITSHAFVNFIFSFLILFWISLIFHIISNISHDNLLLWNRYYFLTGKTPSIRLSWNVDRHTFEIESFLISKNTMSECIRDSSMDQRPILSGYTVMGAWSQIRVARVHMTMALSANISSLASVLWKYFSQSEATMPAIYVHEPKKRKPQDARLLKRNFSRRTRASLQKNSRHSSSKPENTIEYFEKDFFGSWISSDRHETSKKIRKNIPVRSDRASVQRWHMDSSNGMMKRPEQSEPIVSSSDASHLSQ